MYVGVLFILDVTSKTEGTKKTVLKYLEQHPNALLFVGAVHI